MATVGDFSTNGKSLATGAPQLPAQKLITPYFLRHVSKSATGYLTFAAKYFGAPISQSIPDLKTI
jgi:hypothetical protein